MKNSTQCVQLLGKTHRKNQSIIERALIDILTSDSDLVVKCFTRRSFKPIWDQGPSTNNPLSQVVEQEDELSYNPTQASIVKALCCVDEHFQYQISGDESRATCGNKKKYSFEMMQRACMVNGLKLREIWLATLRNLRERWLALGPDVRMGKSKITMV